jgi:hypothetical protein
MRRRTVKKNLFLLVLMIIIVLIFTNAYSQEEMTEVDNSVFIHPERPPSLFEHDVHNENAGIDECNVCHHVYEDGKLLERDSSDQTCSECHKLTSKDKKPKLMKAFHLNCKGCHLKKKTGPIMCGECHRK